MQINLGAFTVFMKYLSKRPNRKTYYYRRRVPEDLLRHYDKSYIEVSQSLQIPVRGSGISLSTDVYEVAL